MAMNINELMIGNLVYANVYLRDPNHIPEITQIPVKVIGIGDNGDIVIVKYEDRKTLITSDRLIPIQLTAEILEKNWFVNKTQFMQCGRFGMDFLITWQLKEEKVLGHCAAFLCINNWSEEDRPSYRGKCLYVHELQNALRCCRLEKMAREFKVL